jgi:hypothetical protein
MNYKVRYHRSVDNLLMLLNLFSVFNTLVMQLHVELDFQADPSTTFSLVTGSVVSQVKPHMHVIINLILAKVEQQKSAESPPWHYTLRSVAAI